MQWKTNIVSCFRKWWHSCGGFICVLCYQWKNLLSVSLCISHSPPLSLSNILSAASNSCSLNLQSLGPEQFIWLNINIHLYKLQEWVLLHYEAHNSFCKLCVFICWYNDMIKGCVCGLYHWATNTWASVLSLKKCQVMFQPSVEHIVRNISSCLPHVVAVCISTTQTHLSDVKQNHIHVHVILITQLLKMFYVNFNTNLSRIEWCFIQKLTKCFIRTENESY